MKYENAGDVLVHIKERFKGELTKLENEALTTGIMACKSKMRESNGQRKRTAIYA